MSRAASSHPTPATNDIPPGLRSRPGHTPNSNSVREYQICSSKDEHRTMMPEDRLYRQANARQRRILMSRVPARATTRQNLLECQVQVAYRTPRSWKRSSLPRCWLACRDRLALIPRLVIIRLDEYANKLWSSTTAESIHLFQLSTVSSSSQPSLVDFHLFHVDHLNFHQQTSLLLLAVGFCISQPFQQFHISFEPRLRSSAPLQSSSRFRHLVPIDFRPLCSLHISHHFPVSLSPCIQKGNMAMAVNSPTSVEKVAVMNGLP